MVANNLDANSDFVREQFGEPSIEETILPSIITGGSGFVSSVNGVNGSITFAGGTTGLTFTPAGSIVTLGGVLVVASGGTGQSSYTKGDILAATGATALGKLGVGANNARLVADSGQTTGLAWVAASTGWSNWTGTADRTAHATYSGTASVGYVQAELQAVMDKLKEITEAYKALVDDLKTQKVLNA